MSEGPDPETLRRVARESVRLREALRFDWPAPAEHGVRRILLDDSEPALPVFVGVVGGASSGKSTVFNNLLGGHQASRVTARGHITLGPILACHQDQRTRLERHLAEGSLFPRLECVPAELDGNVTGRPGELTLIFHVVDPLRDILLFDLPDFTSESARTEGDLTLTLLPWFDRLLVVVDHERWFDRQSFSTLRSESVRFGQQRWVLFNRTQEGELADADQRRLRRQAELIAAEGSTVLQFRRGRGFRLFPPGTLDDVVSFARAPKPRRTCQLRQYVAQCANTVLNQNEQRQDGWQKLNEAVHAAVRRTLPIRAACTTALLTPEERGQLEPLTRILQWKQTRSWFIGGTRRLYSALREVPVVGRLLPRYDAAAQQNQPAQADRIRLGVEYARSLSRRQAAEVNRVVAASLFWDEIRRWTGLEPPSVVAESDPGQSAAFIDALEAFDRAVARWNEKVESECRGLTPHFKGAVGVGAIGLLVVLIAAPGPLTALTLVAAKGAVGTALTQLLTAAGAGAVFGKTLSRLVAVFQERLIGSAEFNAVHDAAGDVGTWLEVSGAQIAEQASREAARLVLPDEDPLKIALQELRAASEQKG